MTRSHALTNYLLTHRKRLGYTQKQVADALRCSEHQVYRYEQGRRLPDLKTAIRLELFYKASLQTLFAGLYEEARHQLGKQVHVREASDAAPAVAHGSGYGRKRRRILALDPWTRAIGFAVLEGEELLCSGVRWLGPVPLPDRLLVKGESFVQGLIEFYRPSAVVLSKTDYPGSRRSKHVRAFCRVIKELALAKRLRFVESAPNEVKSSLAQGGKLNKHGIAVAVGKRFPELTDKVPSPRKPWESQDLRMSAFQAVALALVVEAGETCTAERTRE